MKKKSLSTLRLVGTTDERGASLILVMITLMIISILGIAGMQISMMSERGARNDRDQQIAWEAAEAALLDAEQDIFGPSASSRRSIFTPVTDAQAFVDGCGKSGNSRGLCATVKRGMKAMVVPADRSQWSSGWIIFVDKDGDQVYSETNDITILTQEAPASYFSISGTGSATGPTPYILYDGSGYSRLKNGGFGALTLSLSRNDLSGSALYEQTRRLVIAKTGRVRTCRPASAADTTCAANSTQ